MVRQWTNRTRKKGLWAAVWAMLAGVPLSAAESNQAWVAQYNGPDSYEEQVRGLVVRDGFVYVTGFTIASFHRSYATAKYDYQGQQIWARVYQGFLGPSRPDEAEALAVDAAGNVYVTGWSIEKLDGGASFVDVATLKYDAQGDLLWERRYRSPGANNQPQAMALDPDENIYVAGASWVNGGFDLMLLKYAPDGTLLWDRTLGQSGGRWDSGVALSIDAAGNPIVAGYTEPFAQDSAAYLVKFDAQGSLRWVRERDGFSNVDAWERVQTDAAGNIFVLGEISPPGKPLHLWTAKYDPAGTLLWEQHYGGTASMSNYAGGLAVDPEGGVAVCGQSWDLPSTISIVTLKYAADGTLAWQRLEKAGYGNASGQDVAVDSRGRVYTTGYGYHQNGYEDIITLCYEPDGALAWTQIYADPHGRSDYSTAIAVDDAANVFVTGDAWVGFENYYDFTTIRYSPIALGDLNCDGQIDFADIGPFVLALSDPTGYATGYPRCNIRNGDCNGDGAVDFGDIAPFLELLGR